MEHAEDHINEIENFEKGNPNGLEYDEMSVEQKIKITFMLYDRATNPEHPDRKTYTIGDSMHGRVMNEIKSYNYMDNQKYKKIKQLVDIMKETFGYDKPQV